jgi:hypothetical protein
MAYEGPWLGNQLWSGFGISLNCKFGTDKAARHGGYRAAQSSAPTVPVGTCQHHELPVGTCRHLRLRPRTDDGSVAGRTVTGSVSNVGPISAIDRHHKLYLKVVPTRPSGCLTAVGRNHAVYRPGPSECLTVVGRNHAMYHQIYRPGLERPESVSTCIILVAFSRHQHAFFCRPILGQCTLHFMRLLINDKSFQAILVLRSTRALCGQTAHCTQCQTGN